MSDRKYRHRGYQDDDRDDRDDRDRRSRPPGEGGGRRPGVEGAPRGRGVGIPASVAFKCSVCGRQVHDSRVAFDAACSGCGKPLHSCTNCSFFDPGARFECRKPIAKRVESKTKANQCTFFQPKVVRDLRSKRTTGDASSPGDARAAFDALFKKK